MAAVHVAAVVAVGVAAVLTVKAGREAGNRKGAVVVSEGAIAAADTIAAVVVAGAIACAGSAWAFR